MNFKDFFLKEQDIKSIALLPGGFKPPHKGHFEALKYLLKTTGTTHAIVFVGKLTRDGITQDQAVKIWDIYSRYIPAKIEIVPAIGMDKAGREASPLSMTYDFIEDNKNVFSNFYVGAGREDLARYRGLEKNKEKYPNTTIVSIPPQFNRISGTVTRSNIQKKNINAIEFIPPEVREKNQIKTILSL